MPRTVPWLAWLVGGLLSGPVSAAAQTGVIWLAREQPVATAASREGKPAGARTPGAAAGHLTVEPADRADTPLTAGSVLKIATIAAALESGTISPSTGVSCARVTAVAGHTLRCSHPDRHRPLRPDEALSDSCNVFAVTVAQRLPRSALDRVLVDLGLPPSDPAVPLAAAAVGVDGMRVTPRQLLTMIERVAADPSPLPWNASTLAVVRKGLRDAARSGTAAALSALSRRGAQTVLAKTGTTVSGGRPLGVVAGVVTFAGGPPAERPGRTVSFVLVAAGGAGVDAASLAADRLANLAHPDADRVTIGVPNVSGRPGRDGYDVRVLPLEEYVAGVVTGEAAAAAGPAALAALAITVRTYALANRGRHRADGFDLCTLTHCQVLRPPSPAATAATRLTAGQVLLDRGRLPAVYFSASCGGHTASPSEIWPGASEVAYLPARPDAACAGQPVWRADVDARDLMRALRQAGVAGDLVRDLRVTARTASGRVRRLALDGMAPGELSGDEFQSIVGRTLGWNVIRSTAFDIERTAAGFRFKGRGAGHGVGLCVRGSVARAAQGQGAPEILAAYFPGLTIGPAPMAEGALSALPAASPAGGGGQLIVTVPQDDRPEAERLRRTAMQVRDELAGRLALTPPARLTLRFHPTVESYQRATGRQWFTAGATTADGQAHFLPLATLRERGVLDQTMRHELVHLLTAAAYRGRPVWVHEGAAEFFGGVHAQAEIDALPPGATSGARRSTNSATCPSDAELLRPVSREALRSAYRQALTCFADELAGGRAWRDVGAAPRRAPAR